MSQIKTINNNIMIITIVIVIIIIICMLCNIASSVLYKDYLGKAPVF